MPLYQLLNSDRRLKPFHSTAFSSHYHESDLEDWLEANPQVLVSDEPLLVIGRQVNTSVGVIDLLALDAEGAIVVVELKRAPNQRSTIAQSLEYAAWISAQNRDAICQIAEKYLVEKSLSLKQAWQQVFDSELPQLSPGKQHRIFVVVEGDDNRLISVARYLRNAGVDISLLTYNYYRTETGDEILHIEKLVGDDGEFEQSTPASSAFPTERELLEKWHEEVRQAYGVFKEELTRAGLVYTIKKTQVSYRTQDGRIFVCGFHGSGRNFKIWLRSDSLNNMFEFDAVAEEIKSQVGEGVDVLHTETWFVITYPASATHAKEAADLIIGKIARRLE